MTTFGELLQLKWNDHSNGIAKAFVQSFMNEQLVDVTLSCQGELIRVHRLILSAASPYFEMLFRLHQQKDIVIIINAMSINHLRLLIEFMYTGEIRVKEQDLLGFLQAAEQLQIKSLSDVLKKKAKRQNFKNKNCSTIHPDTNLNDVPAEIIEDKNILKESVSCTNNQEQTSSFNSKNNSLLNTANEESNSAMMNKSLDIIPDESIDKTTIENEITEDLKDKVDVMEKRIDSKKLPKICRPPNAFMVFANQWRKKLAAEYSADNSKEISIRLGHIWRNFKADEKAQYYKESQRADQEHRLKYPEYKYNPKEARKRKLKNPTAAIKRKKNIERPLVELKATDQISEIALKQYESSESADEPKYDSTSEYKPELSDVINAVIGMGVTNCIIENNNIVTKADFDQNKLNRFEK